LAAAASCRSARPSLVDEALKAAAVEVFADIDVAFAVDRKRMRHVQRSAEDALLPKVMRRDAAKYIPSTSA
jgi:hypothetical protein